jgi:uncharacterized membrane protein
MPLSWLELHGAMTHFPIALFLVSAFLEVAAFIAHNEDWRKTSYLLLLIGVVMSIPTLYSGWMSVETVFAGAIALPPILLIHRTLAFATVILALILLIVRWTTHDKPSIIAFSILCSVIIAIMIGTVGYLGGKMVFGGVTVDIISTHHTASTPQGGKASSNTPGRQAQVLAIMKSNGCLSCHSMNGSGGISAQDLTHEGARHPDVSWQIKHLKDPNSVSPGSSMPSFAAMPPSQLKLLATFLANKK